MTSLRPPDPNPPGSMRGRRRRSSGSQCRRFGTQGRSGGSCRCHMIRKQGREPITKVEWLVPPNTNRCGVKGVCGPNSFCRVTASGETSCSCLPGFEFPSDNQSAQGCWRVQPGGCTGNRSNGDIGPIATMVEVKNTSWSDRSYNVPPQSTTIEECKAICLSDCACEIAMFDTFCSKQMLPMRYGKIVPRSKTTLFVKVYSYEQKGAIRGTRSASSAAMLISGAALVIFSLVVLSVSLLFCKHRQFLRYTRAPQQQDTQFDEESIGVRSYSFHDLELSTDGFTEELGRGAYGTVFKGVLTNSGTEGIAVKRLERMAEDGEREFQRELAGEECNISEWAYEYVASRDGLKEVAAGEDVNEVELERMVKIGIWCTQNQPVTRPAMKSVVLMMEGSVEVRRPPPPASFSQSLLRSRSS
ncbi:hypothetical protein ABZP36_025679 [Zizania latifolia]